MNFGVPAFSDKIMLSYCRLYIYSFIYLFVSLYFPCNIPLQYIPIILVRLVPLVSFRIQCHPRYCWSVPISSPKEIPLDFPITHNPNCIPDVDHILWKIPLKSH